MSADIFHAHLDVCQQCREHPFDLCKEGAVLLREAAEGLPPREPRQPGKTFNFAPDHYGGPIQFMGPPLPSFFLHKREPRPQSIPIRTEVGKEIRKAFTGSEPEVLLDADYSEVEKRLLAAFSGTHGKFVCAECGCETNTSMEKPCVACGSVKVVLLSLAEQLFGKNWRECFKDPK